MNNSEFKKLEHFVRVSNRIKYTIGLPLLIFNSLRFYKRLAGAYLRLYVNIVVNPDEIKNEFSYIERLNKGLRLLWKPNRLVSK